MQTPTQPTKNKHNNLKENGRDTPRSCQVNFLPRAPAMCPKTQLRRIGRPASASTATSSRRNRAPTVRLGPKAPRLRRVLPRNHGRRRPKFFMGRSFLQFPSKPEARVVPPAGFSCHPQLWCILPRDVRSLATKGFSH